MFIEISTIKKQIEENPLMYKYCCHLGRPGHSCNGNIQMEHPWSRSCGGDKNRLHPIIVPVCSSMNYSPSKEDKAWSKKIAFEYYGIDNLKKLCNKKDWDSELRLVNSFIN